MEDLLILHFFCTFASLQKTSLIEGWKPSTKIFFLHGNKDTIVPYSNSEKAYQQFRWLRCDVELITIKGKDHKEAGNLHYNLFAAVHYFSYLWFLK